MYTVLERNNIYFEEIVLPFPNESIVALINSLENTLK